MLIQPAIKTIRFIWKKRRRKSILTVDPNEVLFASNLILTAKWLAVREKKIYLNYSGRGEMESQLIRLIVCKWRTNGHN